MILDIDKVPDGAILNKPIKNCYGDIVVQEGSVVGRDTIAYATLNDYLELDVAFCVPDNTINRLTIHNMSNMMFMMFKNASMEDKQALATVIVNNAMTENELSLMNRLKDYSYETYVHSLTVAQYAVLLCTALNINRKNMHRILKGAILHDVGKLMIPKEVLHKIGKFSPEDRIVMNQHPKLGIEILNEYDITDSIVRDIVLHHHENWIGNGYPDKLKYNNISSYAMIVHIADVYSALNMRRTYKVAIERSKVWDIMMDGTGTQFSPLLMNIVKNKLPVYFIGELVSLGDNLFAKVIGTNEDIFNPTVYFNGKMMDLRSAFELVKEVEEEAC